MIDSTENSNKHEQHEDPKDEALRQQQRRQITALRSNCVPFDAVKDVLKVDRKTAEEIARETWRHRSDQLRMESVHVTQDRVEFVLKLLRDKVKNLDARTIDQWIKLCSLENQLLNTALRYTDRQPQDSTCKVVVGVDMEAV